MNSAPTSQPAPRFRIRWWWWVLGGLAASFLIVTIAVLDTLTLNRDARALRRAAFSAVGGHVDTKVQLTAGWMLLGAARTCTWFINDMPPEARLALEAVRSASVGVYQLRHDIGRTQRTKLFTEADAAMTERGWTRTVGVNNHSDTVLVYIRDGADVRDTQRVCVVVCEANQLVIVAAAADPGPLIELAARKGALAWAN